MMRGVVIVTRCPAASVTAPYLRPCNSPSHYPLLLPPLLFSSSSSPRFGLRRANPVSASIRGAARSVPSSMAAPTDSVPEPRPFSLLFVCLGNICRSPAAEAVFRDTVCRRGLEANFKIDSAGTIGYHEGGPADPRMRAAAKKRGVEVTSISRPIRPSDFREFDLILAMDMQNREDILSAYERWRFRETLPEDAPNKVKLMCSYCKKHKETEVPDPYYGGPQGFEKPIGEFLPTEALEFGIGYVLDLLEDACEALLDSILAENSCVSTS